MAIQEVKRTEHDVLILDAGDLLFYRNVQLDNAAESQVDAGEAENRVADEDAAKSETAASESRARAADEDATPAGTA